MHQVLDRFQGCEFIFVGCFLPRSFNTVKCSTIARLARLHPSCDLCLSSFLSLALSLYTPTPFSPLAQHSEVLDKFQDCEFTCEYKYDGERAQLHVLENKSVLIFSRNSENNTAKYPDIVQV